MAIFKSRTINAGLSVKTIKSDKASDYVTAILYLAPADQVGGINVCPMAVIAGCKHGCLNLSGRGRFNSVQAAREQKTRLYRDNRDTFMKTLVGDLERFVRWCSKRDVKPAVRLNGTSDIQWEIGHPVVRNGTLVNSVFEAFPEIQFYDYTKIVKRAYRKLPSNYHLTLSYSEANLEYADSVMRATVETGINAAVVYRTRAIAEKKMSDWPGVVVDGDKTDLRFLDPQGHKLVALYAKGAAKHDTTGFVID